MVRNNHPESIRINVSSGNVHQDLPDIMDEDLVMAKRRFFQVQHSDVQNAFLDAFVESSEFVTLVDCTGRYFHGRIISHDKLSLVLGTKNPLKPLTLFNKRELTMVVPQNAVKRASPPSNSNGKRRSQSNKSIAAAPSKRSAPGPS